MKKIAVALDSFPEVGGGHQYTLLILEALQNKEDIEILYLCNTPFWRVWCHKNNVNYAVINWPAPTDNVWSTNKGIISRKYNEKFTQLGDLLKKEKIDVLFVTLQILFIPPLNVKVVTPVHDLMHRYERRFPEVGTSYEQRERIFKLQAQYADVILTDSKLGTKQYMESYGDFVKKNQKIVELPFVPPDYIRDIKEEYIETPSKYIFYAAQFWKHKNQINLVKAIDLIKDEIPDIRLVLCGSKKNYYYDVKNYIEKNNLWEYVKICGYVSNEQMVYLYKHATAMFMPTFFGPTNIPPLEAMQLGCPVAVSNNYGMPEQVGDAGLTFDPENPREIAECIKKIWNDEELRHQMIDKGYKQLAKWTSEDFKKRVLEIVKNI